MFFSLFLTAVYQPACNFISILPLLEDWLFVICWQLPGPTRGKMLVWCLSYIEWNWPDQIKSRDAPRLAGSQNSRQCWKSDMETKLQLRCKLGKEIGLDLRLRQSASLVWKSFSNANILSIVERQLGQWFGHRHFWGVKKHPQSFFPCFFVQFCIHNHCSSYLLQLCASLLTNRAASFPIWSQLMRESHSECINVTDLRAHDATVKWALDAHQNIHSSTHILALNTLQQTASWSNMQWIQ